MTNTGDQEFVKGWFLCSHGQPLPDDASDACKDGYVRCYETEQRLTNISEEMEINE